MEETSVQDYSVVFTKGYEKGFAEGVDRAQAVLNLALSQFPSGMEKAAAKLLPGGDDRHPAAGTPGGAIAAAVYSFGKNQYNKGARDQKAYAKKKAAADAAAAVVNGASDESPDAQSGTALRDGA
jgi:hypothetical protein